ADLHLGREPALVAVDADHGLAQLVGVQPRLLLAALDERLQAVRVDPRVPFEDDAVRRALLPRLCDHGYRLGGRVHGHPGARPHARLGIAGVEQERAGLLLRFVLDRAPVLRRVPGLLDRRAERVRRLEALEGEGRARPVADLVLEGHRHHLVALSRRWLAAGDDARLEVSLPGERPAPGIPGLPPLLLVELAAPPADQTLLQC